MRRRIALLIALVATALLAPNVVPHGASAALTWAPADRATIHPGVQTFTPVGQCTANFVFYDAQHIYIGQAAHCSGTGAANETNGCDSGSLPLGTKVQVDGATHPGTMVYNSWLTMQRRNERNVNACRYNDFALVRLDPRDHGKVNPTIPFWGGPTGVARKTTLGEQVLSYGNSGLRFEISALSPKDGYSLGSGAGGWTHSVYTATPGIPGDSGSAFINADGHAMGVLSTVQLAPLALSNGVSDLWSVVAYANAHGGLKVTLARGTEPFAGGLLP